MCIYNNMSKVIKKLIGRGLLLVFVLCQFILFGFTENNSDNLYSYQWGLKNSGSFFVPRTILANSHIPFYFDKAVNDQMFFDTKDTVDYLRTIGNTSYVAYAVENFDTNWENGYAYFKTIPAARDAIIAVIDTGIDVNHFELKESIWINHDEIPNNGIDDDNNGYIDDYNYQCIEARYTHYKEEDSNKNIIEEKKKFIKKNIKRINNIIKNLKKIL